MIEDLFKQFAASLGLVLAVFGVAIGAIRATLSIFIERDLEVVGEFSVPKDKVGWAPARAGKAS